MQFAILFLLLFGIAQVNAYSLPGGYERVLFYYLYSIDAQLNDGKPTLIAAKCSTTTTPCTLDQFLRYIAKTSAELPTRSAPATSYPALPDMDTTAQALSTKGPDNLDFAVQTQTKRVLPDASGDYSKFLSELEQPIIKFSGRAPEHANLLKLNVQAIRNFRLAATLTTFMQQEYAQGLDVRSKSIPLYDGAPDNLRVNIIDAPATVQANEGMSKQSFAALWKKNAKGGHLKNTDQLQNLLDNLELKCS